MSYGSIEKQATDRLECDRFRLDDDDLAAGRRDAGQRSNVRAVRHDKEVSWTVHLAMSARAPEVNVSR